jgi:hypothetical protein
MNIYVESNFVLELALLQEQFEACENILAICEAGETALVLPAFCIAEPYETLVRRAKHRGNLSRDLTTELGQLSRSEPYREEFDGPDIVDALDNYNCKLLPRFDSGYDYIQCSCQELVQGEAGLKALT